MGEISLQDALNQFIKNSKLKHGLRSVRIEQLWEDIMGKTIARYTDKLQIVEQTLFITTHVAPLKNELIFQKATIIKRVNEAFGEDVIREIVVN